MLYNILDILDVHYNYLNIVLKRNSIAIWR